MIVNLHFNWLPENALNKAYQVWLPDININFLDIWIDTTTTKERKKLRRRKEIKTRKRIRRKRAKYYTFWKESRICLLLHMSFVFVC